MTEYDIECKAERLIDALDKRFLAGFINGIEYENEIRIIDTWANQQYKAIAPAPFKEDFLHYE